jgi:3-carboxy-cis,cis-muconate cycloisomerase
MSDCLHSFLLSTPEMTRVFAPEQQLRAMMRFEWALSCALEKHGLAAKGSAVALESLLDASFIHLDSMQIEAKSVGNLVIPFVRQLTATVKVRNDEASRAIHLGATSQDVLDSALVLQVQDALKLLEGAIKKLDAALVTKVRMHRDTLLTGRTWLQPGPPTTLGLKLAGTLIALRRGHERIQTAAQRALVVQFGGAVGTLASLGAVGAAISMELARTLELREPILPWHTQRDNLAEIVQVLALLTGSLAKFAGDIALMMQHEVGEASERSDNGRGGSSTMPHKHNPVGCAAVTAAHIRMPGLVATMLHAMPQEHERGLGLWQAEWDIVPEAFRLAAAALAYSLDILESLEVDPARMQANFDGLYGLTLAEAVNAALASKMGRSEAHDLLREATTRAAEEKRHLRAVLMQLPEVTAHLSNEEIERLMEPRAYLGSARLFIARVLGEPDAPQLKGEVCLDRN